MNKTAIVFRGVTPFLKTDDLAQTIRFYVDLLGFVVDSKWPVDNPTDCILDNGEVHLAFGTDPQNWYSSPGLSGQLWIDVDEFRRAAVAALRSGEAERAAAALELYPGPLLPEDLHESWTEPARGELDVARDLSAGQQNPVTTSTSTIAAPAAEELDVAIDRFTIVSGDTQNAPDEGSTSSSQSIEMSGRSVRLVTAELRSRIIDRLARRCRPLGLEECRDRFPVRDRRTAGLQSGVAR